MGYIIGVSLMFILGVIGFMMTRLYKDKKVVVNHEEASHGVYVVGWIMAVLMVVGIVMYTVIGGLNKIGSRDVGVVTFGGKIIGQTGHGWVYVEPWKDVETQSIAVQKFKIGPSNGGACDASSGLTAFSSETQPVYVCATLNWHVNNDDVQSLYQRVGPAFEDVIIPSRVNQAFKDEMVKFKAVQIAPHREAIRLAVLQHLKDTLGKYSINADDLNIDDIEFSPQFQKAIDDKQVATQEALAAKNRVAVAVAKANQVAATASGDARATLIKATAQAKANDLLSKSITPALIQYQYVQKIAEGVKTIVVPEGTNTIIPSDGLSNSGAAGGTSSSGN